MHRKSPYFLPVEFVLRTRNFPPVGTKKHKFLLWAFRVFNQPIGAPSSEQSVRWSQTITSNQRPHTMLAAGKALEEGSIHVVHSDADLSHLLR